MPRLQDRVAATAAAYLPGPAALVTLARSHERPFSGPARDVRHPARRAAAAAPDPRRLARALRPRRLRADRDALRSRTPTCSCAGSARAPTSSTRRCSPSRTRAGAASPCARRRTAAICRAYVEHGMHRLPQPVKLWAWGPMFRHERPQAGRYRQFNQLDAEVIGSESPLVDAELILLLDDLLREIGVPGLRLRLSSLGTPASRAVYRDELREYLRDARGRARQGGARADRREPAARIRRQGSRHPGGDGRGAADARPARRRRRRALRRRAPPARPVRRRLRARRDPGPRARLLHADRVRVRVRAPRRPGRDPRRRRPLRRAGRGARRPVGSRLRLGRGDRAASCLRWTSPSPSRRPTSSSPRRPSRAPAPSRWCASCAAPACARSSTSPGARRRGR